jgi:hypothetical protein
MRDDILAGEYYSPTAQSLKNARDAAPAVRYALAEGGSYLKDPTAPACTPERWVLGLEDARLFHTVTEALEALQTAVRREPRVPYAFRLIPVTVETRQVLTAGDPL